MQEVGAVHVYFVDKGSCVIYYVGVPPLSDNATPLLVDARGEQQQQQQQQASLVLLGVCAL
jgi:hypothetical protein